MMIHAQLSSDTIARSCGIEIKSPSPVLALCRRLLDEGCQSSAPLEAYRSDVLCLHVRSIGEAAALKVGGEGIGFRPANQPDTAPPISLTTPSSLAA
jgi:hypothetical protein